MLKVLRKKKTAKKIWIGLGLIIIPAFVFWGLGSAVSSKKESVYAGRIFGRNITTLEYQDALDAARVNATMRFGDNLSEIKKHLNLESEAWDRLILLFEAKRRKISASDREVIEAIENSPLFQRRGQFDNKLYAETLQYVLRVHPRAFEEQTRQDIMLMKLYKQVTEKVELTDEQLRKEYEKANAQVSIHYIVSDPNDFANTISFSEQELKDYFTKNSFKFKQPLSFNIEYVSLDSADKIKRLALLLKKKDDFTKATKEVGATLKETGLFGEQDAIPGIGWSEDILALIAKLKVNQYSQPLQIDKKYYILRLKEKKEAFIPDFKEIKDRVKESFLKDRSEELAKDKIQQCLNKIKTLSARDPKAADFNKLAKEFGLKSKDTELFKYGSYVEGIGASDNFWMSAQALKENETSDVISLPTGFYIVRLKNKVGIDEEKFLKEKETFKQKMLALRQQEAFAQFLKDLKRKSR